MVPGLTDIECAWLLSIDAMLMHATPQAHAVTAGRIVDLWDAGGVVFQQELSRRADMWRKRQVQMTMVVADLSGPCQKLLQLLDVHNGGQRKKRLLRPRPKSKNPNRPSVRPSRRHSTPSRRITDTEVKQFLELIDAEGISVVFDPGVRIIDDNVFQPPLIVIEKVSVFHEDIARVYERVQIKRPWDPVPRVPAIALAFDLALLVMLREKKWTWVICDRHFSRLPWGHPCKATPEGRPGWKLITAMLKDAGLIELRRGQTWRLTKLGKVAAEHLSPAWIAAAEPSRD